MTRQQLPRIEDLNDIGNAFVEFARDPETGGVRSYGGYVVFHKDGTKSHVYKGPTPLIGEDYLLKSLRENHAKKQQTAQEAEQMVGDEGLEPPTPSV